MTTHQHTHSATGAVDPVCGMTIAPEDAAGKFTHNGHTYYFCSQSCLDRFRADPEEFLQPKEHTASASGDAVVEYTCPMHPQIRQVGPGSCPICGMALDPEAPALEDVAARG